MNDKIEVLEVISDSLEKVLKTTVVSDDVSFQSEVYRGTKPTGETYTANRDVVEKWLSEEDVERLEADCGIQVVDQVIYSIQDLPVGARIIGLKQGNQWSHVSSVLAEFYTQGVFYITEKTHVNEHGMHHYLVNGSYMVGLTAEESEAKHQETVRKAEVSRHIMVKCPTCDVLASVESTDCPHCDEDLVDQLVEVHSTLVEDDGCIYNTGFSVYHKPHDDSRSHLNYYAVVSQVPNVAEIYKLQRTMKNTGGYVLKEWVDLAVSLYKATDVSSFEHFIVEMTRNTLRLRKNHLGGGLDALHGLSNFITTCIYIQNDYPEGITFNDLVKVGNELVVDIDKYAGTLDNGDLMFLMPYMNAAGKLRKKEEA